MCADGPEGPCDPGVYASGPSGLSGQLVTMGPQYVPRALILHVRQSLVALVITSQCMCQGAPGALEDTGSPRARSTDLVHYSALTDDLLN